MKTKFFLIQTDMLLMLVWWFLELCKQPFKIQRCMRICSSLAAMSLCLCQWTVLLCHFSRKPKFSWKKFSYNLCSSLLFNVKVIWFLRFLLITKKKKKNFSDSIFWGDCKLKFLLIVGLHPPRLALLIKSLSSKKKDQKLSLNYSEQISMLPSLLPIQIIVYKGTVVRRSTKVWKAFFWFY